MSVQHQCRVAAHCIHLCQTWPVTNLTGARRSDYSGRDRFEAEGGVGGLVGRGEGSVRGTALTLAEGKAALHSSKSKRKHDEEG